MPILKQLMLSSSQVKRRSRADLTPEMISAPLGDFRHTMHVGRGGDAFGDTSFLSSRCVEPPREPQPEQSSLPKQGLLARTFRSSKRSHSSSRTDKPENSKPTPPGGPLGDSPSYVKNAISLPHLNDDHARQSRGTGLFPMSVSCSPAKKLPQVNLRPANGTMLAVRDLELDEQAFGELTDLPVSSAPPRGGMKHAESVLSFHIDLGPSMLGDILSVMDKKGDTELLYEEELMPRPCSEPVEEVGPPVRPPRLRQAPSSPYTPEAKKLHPDTCCESSSDCMQSPYMLLHDSTKHGSSRDRDVRDDRDFSFMDEDDDEDEIRV